MRVFLTGATGVLGRRLVDRFVAAGHEVYGLARDDRGVADVEHRGGLARRGDVLDRESLRTGAPDVDVVVHAATAIPTARKPRREDWQLNNRVRLAGARNLIELMGDSIEQFVFPSVVWVARRPDGGWIDESTPRNPDLGTAGAATTEEYLETARDRHGVRTAVLRCGLFYAADASSTREFAARLLEGKMVTVGRGLLGRRAGPLSHVHPDDAARAFVEAVKHELEGIYHVVDDRPTTFESHLHTLADVLNAPPPGPRLPAWLARLFVGRVSADLVSKPMPSRNDTFRAVTDWQPTFPTQREGFDQVVAEWVASGDLVETDTGVGWAGETSG